jgi:hypothetical protein
MKIVKLFDAVHSVATIEKNRSDRRSICCRPNRSEIDAMKGWKTALVRRYDVPAQNGSIEVPLRATASVFCGQLSKNGKEGDDYRKDFASRATMSETIEIVIIKRYSSLRGFHSVSISVSEHDSPEWRLKALLFELSMVKRSFDSVGPKRKNKNFLIKNEFRMQRR